MGSLPKALPRPRLPGFLADRSSARTKGATSRKGRRARRLPSWPVLRRWIVLALLVLVALLSAYLFWFRSSSFVAVEEVRITGAEQAPDVDAALRAAADGQSTLNLDSDALDAAVAGNPAVRGITLDAQFPHTLLIDVDAREPVAYLGAEQAVVAADGVVLEHTGDRPDGLPGIEIDGDKTGLVSGDEVTGDALEVSRVIGAAPGPLADSINEGAMTSEHGVTVDLGPGIELRFGDAGAADLKWKAVAAVLADPKFTGAAYLDLSVPDRPVAGGVADDPASTEASAEATVTTDPEVPVEAAVPTDPAVTSDPSTSAIP